MNRVNQALLAAASTFAIGSAGAATILVSDDFDGANGTNLNATSADVFHADLVTAGGDAGWDGSANIKADGAAYGNNYKIVYLDLGSYINDAKGDADAIFTLSATLAPNGSQRGNSINWMGFSTSSAPGVGNGSTAIASVGIDADGNTIGTNFGPVLDGTSYTTTAATAGAHTLSVELDLTAANYDGVTSFGKITFSDSVTGSLGSAVLNSDQSFASIALIVAGGPNAGSRTDSSYDDLTLTQAPEPGSLALIALGGLCVLRRRRMH